MSEIHEFKCDTCCAKVAAKFNGEHYLFPKDWMRMLDVDAYERGHLCGKCITKLKIKCPRNKQELVE